MIENRLLSALSVDLYDRLKPNLSQLFLEQGKIIHPPGERIHHVFFPLGCMISITVTMEDGATAETGLVGNRGVSAISALLGNARSSQTEHVVQIAGQAMRIEAGILRQEIERSSELRRILLRYAQAFIAQTSQIAACNRLHSLEQRCARWLLEAQFSVESDQLDLTHRFIANMLGVRRAGVTQAAQKLKSAGLIKYRQGCVQILDQKGLEATACECFSVIKSEYDRLLEPQGLRL